MFSGLAGLMSRFFYCARWEHSASLGYFFSIAPSLYLSETYNKVNSIILTIIVRTAPPCTSYGVCAIDRVTKVN